MNKQLINKYKPEFDHWLNEGKILYKHIHSIAWWNEEPWNYSIDYVTAIIINDEYSKFRKALAEGKTIQINNSKPETWIDIDTDKLANYNPSFLRIKPDESKFKVGDFVTPLNREINCSIWQIDKVLSCGTLVSGSKMLDPRTIQLWTPVKGEWCWFYDNKFKKSSHLAEFKQMSRKFFESEEIGIYDYCEPFLNSLPSYLKDK